MKIAVVQFSPKWENPEANRTRIEQMIDNSDQADLFVLPEMFNTGFTMNAKKNAEEINGPTVQWMQNLARKHNSAITGSIIINDEDLYYNKMIFVFPDGSFKFYNKRHLFRMTGEHEFFEMGKERVIVDYRDWRINLNVCYDLRFPVWSRNQDDYDILINVASWPNARREHWTSLLRARAIENLVYVIGVNRVGQDENGFEYSGYSSVYSPKGEKLLQLVQKEKTAVIEISREEQIQYRNKYSFYLDRDQYTIQ